MPHADREVRLAYLKNYYKKNKTQMREYGRKYHADNREQILIQQKVYRTNPGKRMRAIGAVCIWRAKKKGLPYEPNLLSHLEANPPVSCPCCGKVYDYEATIGPANTKSKGIDDSPSLDRRDNSKGYTLDNIQFICGRCNRIKCDASISELETVLNFMKRGLN